MFFSDGDTVKSVLLYFVAITSPWRWP